MANIAVAAISGSTREFDREYHYIIPERLSGRVKPGMRAIVPFGRSDRLKEAFILDITDKSEYDNLKEIKKVIDEEPVLSSKMIELARWMKRRYICTLSDAVKCMLPAGASVKRKRVVKLTGMKTDADETAQRILDELAKSGGECEYEELGEKCGIKMFSYHIRQLEKMGAVAVTEEFSSPVKEKTVKAVRLAVSREEVVDEIESGSVKRIQQIKVLEMLIESESVSVTDLMRFAGVSRSVLGTLKKRGYIDFFNMEVKRDPLEHKVVESTEPLEPTDEQRLVLEEVKKKLDRGAFEEILLYGVTGSGKTEVYLQLIQHTIDTGKQAVVLVPEISLTPQMFERFKGRFGDDVAVLHSRLSPGERYDQWRLIREGKARVVLGARSAVFAPLDKIGIIIIDEEHETSYKSETTPKYHAAEIARIRCMQENALLLYGSATPSVETFFRAEKGEITLMKLEKRANMMAMPKVSIVDMREELERGNRSVFSSVLGREISENIAAGQQTILFLNRRGYSSFVLCRKCGYTIKCKNCSISMTYHSSGERLICHYCGYTVKQPGICPRCKSKSIRHFGTGTQKVEEELKNLFPGCSVIRMDMDTTGFKNSHDEILSSFRNNNINVLVGTQMIAKGHDFPNVTLVGVIAADSMLNMGDYRAAERTFQLITQVAGRAGRGEMPGRVVIQTYNVDNYSILTACRHDYMSFYRQEIRLRKELEYPPFTNIASVVFAGEDDRRVYDMAVKVKGFIQKQPAEGEERVIILGPTRSPIRRINKRYRWRVIIKDRSIEQLVELLSTAADKFYSVCRKNGVEMNMDINPFNML